MAWRPAVALLAGLLLSAAGVGLLVSTLLMLFGLRAEVSAWSGVSLVLLLCGVYYPVSILPAPLQVVAAGVPLTHFLEAFRAHLGYAPVFTAPLLRGYGLAVRLRGGRLRALRVVHPPGAADRHAAQALGLMERRVGWSGGGVARGCLGAPRPAVGVARRGRGIRSGTRAASMEVDLGAGVLARRGARPARAPGPPRGARGGGHARGDGEPSPAGRHAGPERLRRDAGVAGGRPGGRLRGRGGGGSGRPDRRPPRHDRGDSPEALQSADPASGAGPEEEAAQSRNPYATTGEARSPDGRGAIRAPARCPGGRGSRRVAAARDSGWRRSRSLEAAGRSRWAWLAAPRWRPRPGRPSGWPAGSTSSSRDRRCW